MLNPLEPGYCTHKHLGGVGPGAVECTLESASEHRALFADIRIDAEAGRMLLMLGGWACVGFS